MRFEKSFGQRFCSGSGCKNHGSYILIFTSKKKLAERGTPTEIHYLLEQNLQERYQSILAGHYSISEKIYVETLGLPPSTCHTEDDICQVSRNLNELPG